MKICSSDVVWTVAIALPFEHGYDRTICHRLLGGPFAPGGDISTYYIQQTGKRNWLN
jgi:hypothetical protein